VFLVQLLSNLSATWNTIYNNTGNNITETSLIPNTHYNIRVVARTNDVAATVIASGFGNFMTPNNNSTTNNQFGNSDDQIPTPNAGTSIIVNALLAFVSIILCSC
jgi:hypothetical protein